VVTPGGIMVPPDSPIRRPEQVAGQEVAVGYHSGSHFTTLQALEPFLGREQVKPKFVGSSWARVDACIEGEVPATSVGGITYQVLEQLCFGKIVDTTFMIAFMFPHGVDPAERDSSGGTARGNYLTCYALRRQSLFPPIPLHFARVSRPATPPPRRRAAG
jgi:ABC-type nitrate/sulfonate/bicarbonate transport system substrate-binding protein